MSGRDLEQTDTSELLAAITSALSLLEQHGALPVADRGMLKAAPLPSLLEQALAMHKAALETRRPPVRMIHHMACTGGTLIARSLAAQANVLLLSEIEPLSSLGISIAAPTFAPTDLIRHLRYSLRAVPETTIQAVFLAGLDALLADCTLRGQHLVLRSHAHSRYCHGSAIHEWQNLQDLVMSAHPAHALVTVRNPKASYASLLANGWEHYNPQGPEEYASRYLAFLDDHAELPLFRYEDFVAEPDETLQRICAVLDLPFAQGTHEMIQVVHLTGDSGRSGHQIARRPDRALPEHIVQAIAQSASFATLCERLGY